MTGRERLIAALDHRIVDRVPISTYELVGYNSKSWENLDPSYGRLMDEIREKTDCVCMWDPCSNSALAKTDHVGGDMCLFGCIQLKVLEHGSKCEVREAVRACMASAKQGGGYVIMPTAAPINSPLDFRTEENYLHYIDTALELGAY